jgi:carbon-monoxide dehydrogenase medium subunit
MIDCRPGRWRRPAGSRGSDGAVMKPAPFDYHLAATIDEALALKARLGGEARFLAGGQSLVPAMNFRLAQPTALIDLNGLTGLLDGIEEGSDGGLRLGALVRHRDLERRPEVARRHPLLREAAAQVAHPQIRNRGTIGGNLAHAEPASELPSVMVALDARMHARSTSGERWISAADFFTGALSTALHGDELLVEIAVPALPARTGTCFLEMARRRGDFALMGVAATLTLDPEGRCVAARLVYCNADDRPFDAKQAAAALIGERIAAPAIEAAAEAAARAVRPTGGIHASAAFQRHLAGVLTRRAVARASERAAG